MAKQDQVGVALCQLQYHSPKGRFGLEGKIPGCCRPSLCRSLQESGQLDRSQNRA